MNELQMSALYQSCARHCYCWMLHGCFEARLSVNVAAFRQGNEGYPLPYTIHQTTKPGVLSNPVYKRLKTRFLTTRKETNKME